LRTQCAAEDAVRAGFAEIADALEWLEWPALSAPPARYKRPP
jgi:hypothetical protein